MDSLQNWAIALMIAAIVTETVISAIRGLKLFNLKDSMVNLLMGVFTIAVSLVMKGVTLELFLGMQQYSFTELEFTWVTAGLLFLLSDLHYYWFHRLAHACRFVWASHIVHHSSEKFNLTVAIRLPFANGLYRFIFWSPLCLAGFPPLMVILMDTLVVYYTFFIHTETIGKLGWLEKFLNTPSHHRVHHSNNPEYLDKNFGGVLIIWDKLFRTFVREERKPSYGITKPFRTYNPVKIVCDEWVSIYHDLKKAKGFSQMMKVVFGSPSWKPGNNVSLKKPNLKVVHKQAFKSAA